MDSRVLRRIKTVQDHLITPAPEADVARAETAAQEYGQTLNAEMQTMADERKKSSFNVREMTYFLDEGRQNTEVKERIALQIERDPVLLKKRFFDYSLEEDRARTMASVRRSVAVRKQLRDPALTRVFGELMGKYDRAFTMRTYVHDILFNETIWAQGTAEQYKEWEPLIKNYNVIGCFAMTEMGHSSFLRGLETTATFVKETDEFIIHSPTLTSTKWWIGMAGQTATHTVALCQLKVNEHEHGLYWFIVPLRDRHTGELMPGVSAGHLGAKMGRGGLDNGWIQFSNVRVPRGNMLMKWAQVARDGTFTPPPNAAISYATLIGERILAMVSVHDQVGQSVTIATRYAAVRRQGARDEQVLDYQSHYSVLLPIIAGVYAVHFLRRTLEKNWKETLEGSTEELLRVIQDYHAIAAGLKAWFGWWGADALEAIRRTLGGHGYSAYNAVAGHLADYGVITTGGGDNTILAQQCARYLLSSLQRARQGKALLESVKYFGQWKELLGQKKFAVQRAEELSNAENYLTALRWLSITMVGKAGERLAGAMSSGQDPSDAWNNNLMELINCSKPHSVLYVVETFYRMIDTAQDASLKPVLKQLCDLFAMHYLKQFLVHFIEHGYMTADQAQLIRQYELTLCKQLRPNAVPLVDALNIPDWILKAPIGRYDGNIYENYFRTILEATTSDTVHGGTTPYWSKEVAPLTSPHRHE